MYYTFLGVSMCKEFQPICLETKTQTNIQMCALLWGSNVKSWDVQMGIDALSHEGAGGGDVCSFHDFNLSTKLITFK